MRRGGLLVLLVAATVSITVTAAVTPAAPFQDSSREKFLKQRAGFRAAAVDRHLVIADWCSDKGLLDQALEQCRIAVAITGGGWRTAETRALKRLEGLSPAEIGRKFHRPTKRELKTYRAKAAKAAAADRRERKKLADTAFIRREHLMKEALEEYGALIDGSVGLLPFDEEGRIVLDVGEVPEPVSATYRDETRTILINGRLHVRNRLFSHMAGVGSVRLEESESVRVFTTGELEEAVEYCLLATQLVARLEKDLGASPGRKLVLVLFTGREDYESYCVASGYERHKVAQGFSSLDDAAALVCTDEGEEGHLTRFQTECIVLHELVHLFHFTLAGAALPSWYEEGLAETYGGPGVFTWRKEKLVTGGAMAAARVAIIKDRDGLIPLDEFLAVDAAALNNSDRGKATRFYVQSWAFLRYLRSGAGKSTARRLERWIDGCRAGKLGPAEAAVHFREVFARDLPGMENKFHAYLKKL